MFYLSTLFIEGPMKTKVWQDTTMDSTREAHREGLSTGLKGPSGKWKRSILLHTGKILEFIF